MRFVALFTLLILATVSGACQSGHVRHFKVSKAIQMAAVKAGLPFEWEPPAQWTRVVTESDFILAAYQLPDEAGLTLSTLTGDGGGLLGNINRWGRQLGLAPLQDFHPATRTVRGDHQNFDWVVLAGGKSAIYVAVFTTASATWYFKFSGPSDVLSAHETTYLNTLRTVRFK